MIEAHAAPYCGGPAQLDLSGPDLQLPSRLTFELALILHELATNAAKYGALSRDEGVVQVTWALSEDRREVAIEWKEEGGPSVAPPERRGLGSDLIGGINLGPDADIDLRFPPEGVIWTARLRLREHDDAAS